MVRWLWLQILQIHFVLKEMPRLYPLNLWMDAAYQTINRVFKMDDAESVTMSLGGTERNYAGTERGSVLNFPSRNSILVRSSMRGSFTNLMLQLGPKTKQRGDAASAAGSRASSYRSRRQSASSQMSFSSRSGMRPQRRARKKKAAENVEEDIRVIDENGVDVTPKSLVSLKPTVLHEKLLQASPGHVSPAEFERDKSSSLHSASRYSRRSSVASLTPETLDGDEPNERDDMDSSKKGVSTVKGHPIRKTLLATTINLPQPTSKDYERTVEVLLMESDTGVLLNIRGNSISNAYEKVNQVIERNNRYKKLLQFKLGSDNYSSSAAQTMSGFLKCKEAQISTLGTYSTGVQANSWDIYDDQSDEAEKLRLISSPNAGSIISNSLEPVRRASQHVSATESLMDMVIGDDSHDAELFPSEEEKAALKDAEDEKASSLEVDLNKIVGLARALEIAERAIVQNTYHDRLLLYRDFRQRDSDAFEAQHSVAGQTLIAPAETVVTKRASVGATTTGLVFTGQLYWLWSFESSVTSGRNVSCMVWNKVSKDLLAVGYGQFEFGGQKDGLVGFWSLKNPRYPHAILHTKSGVTALDFASLSPSLLAVGFYSGNLAIYDIRNPKDEQPVVKSSHQVGKHSDPIWKLQWIDSSSEHGETLVSISTDGRVSQWSIKKELEFVNLIKLKLVPSQVRGAQPQPFISRRSAGLCFDFSPRDASIYLVGTEEGKIHKCSRSYNEQYLQTYVGHTGPVYQVRWSPVLPSIFLSCSSDWTVRLWREEQETALLVFQSSNESISDVQWSAISSTVFGTAGNDGHIEIWDLTVSAMKPVLKHVTENVKLSCLIFSEESPIICSAGSSGSISVLRLVGFDRLESDVDEMQKLKDALTAHVKINV